LIGIPSVAPKLAIEKATPSYCSRFGGRQSRSDPNNVRGVVHHANGEKEKGREEGREEDREEEDCEAEEEISLR
jgi:hypothetical protein